jgi:hypothetical protein
MSNLAARYYVILRDQAYNIVAVFDNWMSLTYINKINDIGTHSLKLNALDPRVNLFELDGILQVFRSVPGISLGWYQDYIGFHRGFKYDVSEQGEQTVECYGVSLNDLLSRTIINYPAGTIRSYKNIAAETAMKEYVEENCGPSATIANGREIDGVLPDFSVEADTAAGATWEGDRAFENLMDTLKSIAEYSDIDFAVNWDDVALTFSFQTYVDQLGLDRTNIGLDPGTGLNAAGNAPVVFSLGLGNIKSLSYEYNRVAESNVVSVLGDGDGATRTIKVRTKATKNDSPWNRREVSRPQGGFDNEMEVAGDEALGELSGKEIVGFAPLLQASTMYGKHFFLGDRITTNIRGVDYNKRIISSTDNILDLQIEFSDVII